MLPSPTVNQSMACDAVAEPRLLQEQSVARGWAFSRTKRCMDVAGAALALVVLSGPLLLIGCLVRATSAGPALYASCRVGRGGAEFNMFKFRTMVVHADRQGPLITAADDPRITGLGRTLRRTKLDELPAVWNVLVGHMSLVGPRPENPRSVGFYTEEQRRVLSVRPGLTSSATLKYRNEEQLLVANGNLEAQYFDIMQDKLRLDLQYLDTASAWTDLRLLAQTLGAIVYGR
jgi:lipopolysaccharide/colanic/teichoic acid biosynthesis glycosyltransferase